MKTIHIYKGITLVAAMVLTLSAAATASAQPLAVQSVALQNSTSCGVKISDATLKRNADLMSVGMDIELGSYDMHGDMASVFTPMLVNGADSLAFDPIGVYGRIRYIQYLRMGSTPLGGDSETSFRYAKRPATLKYAQNVPFAEWMNGATLYIRRCDYGCCNTMLDEEYAPLAAWSEVDYKPVYHYITPVAEKVKMRELSGRAYIDFPVNRTELYPDYRKNPAELAKIIATIDSVRNDKDITVKRITIKGWASPESPWENNTRLAKGRTATLKRYVSNLYKFPDNFIETDYYPEDWIGLRAFVETSNLEHRDEILALIDDTTIEPDPKEQLLKKRYPEEYKFLLATVYPGLRHSDYTIEYTIRQFSDPAEIREVMATAPQKLSLEEFFVLAQSLEAGSEEYNDVFETAVRMYPQDATANLNAANAAMQRNDLTNAARYLDKAGDSAEAVYARGVLAALNGDYDLALEYIEAAARAGIEDTEDIQARLRNATGK